MRELIALTDKGSFSDWAPAELELCADFTTAVALGYDWFKDGMNAAQQATAKEFLIQKGMEALAAKLEGKPLPETTRTKQPGTVNTKRTSPPGGPLARQSWEYLAGSASALVTESSADRSAISCIGTAANTTSSRMRFESL